MHIHLLEFNLKLLNIFLDDEVFDQFTRVGFDFTRTRP